MGVALLAIATTTSIPAPAGQWPSAAVDFNRDVRPILSDNCFKCHGFDAKTRDGKRRLDTRESAFAEVDGVHAIVPGKPAESDNIEKQ